MQKKGHYSNKHTEELPAASDKKGTSLLINKEDSLDEEIVDEQYEEENDSVTSEEYQMENHDKDNIALDDARHQMRSPMKIIVLLVMKIMKDLHSYKTSHAT